MPKFFDNQSDDFNVSKYNPAALKMSRLNDIGKLINEVKLSPLSYNQEYADFNFNIWIRCVNNLLGEIEAKFTEDESKECLKIKKAIETFMKKNLIAERNNKGEFRIDQVHFEIIKKHIEMYEYKVKHYQDVHGLDTPNMDDDDGL